MAAVLITGMSGTGKSTALVELGRRGFAVVDTDYGDWQHEVPSADGPERVWREDRMDALLAAPREGPLYVSGTVSNQGRFYDRFTAVVLLTAPPEVIGERLARRTTNDYGKSADERALVEEHIRTVEPRLRASATHVIETTGSLSELVDTLIAIGRGST